jgi:hypothetical protein
MLIILFYCLRVADDVLVEMITAFLLQVIGLFDIFIPNAEDDYDV